MVRTPGRVHSTLRDEDRLAWILPASELYYGELLLSLPFGFGVLYGLTRILDRDGLDLEGNAVAPLRQVLQKPELYLHPVRLGSRLLEIFDRLVVDVPRNAEPVSKRLPLLEVRIYPDLPRSESGTFGVRAIDKKRREGR